MITLGKRLRKRQRYPETSIKTVLEIDLETYIFASGEINIL
jgi:hypothetical protein